MDSLLAAALMGLGGVLGAVSVTMETTRSLYY